MALAITTERSLPTLGLRTLRCGTLVAWALLLRLAHADEGRAPVLVPVEPLQDPSSPATNEPEEQPQESNAGSSAAETAAEPRAGEGALTLAPAGSAVSQTELQEVEVVDAAPGLDNIAGSAHRIDEAQLEAFEYDDAHQVLRQVPGLYMRGEDGYGLRPNIGVRGGNSDRSKKLTLMEDGVLFGPAPYSAPAAYYFPVMTRMTAVDVIKGPGAIRYGPNTVGGTLDLTTRSIPEQAEGAVDGAIGQNFYSKLHAHYGLSGQHFGALAEGVWVRTNGFKELDGGGDTGFDKREFMLKLRANTDVSSAGYHEFNLKLGYSTEISHETYLGLSDADFRENALRRYRASELDRMQWHRSQVQLSHSAVLSDSVELTTTVYRHDFFRIWRKFNGLGDLDLFGGLRNENSSAITDVLSGRADSSELRIGPNERRFVSQGVQTVANLKLESSAVRQFLELGARYHFDSIERDHTERVYAMDFGELVPTDTCLAGNSTAPPCELVVNQGKTRAVALYVADDIVWRDLTVSPGLRAELIHTEIVDELTAQRATDLQTAFLPGLGLMYALAPELSLLAGVHQGFSPVPPTPQSFDAAAVGSADLEPEKSVNYEAGARYTRGTSRAELIGFFNDYSNLTANCSFSSGCSGAQLDQVQSGQRVHVWGLEGLLAHTFRVTEYEFPFRATYTWTRSEFQDDFVSENPQFGDVNRGDSLPYVPEHQLGLTVGVSRGPAAADIAVAYTSESSEQAAAEQFTDAHLVMDLSVRYQLFEPLKLYATATNLLDERYIASRRPFGARPGPPRLIHFGAKYEL